MATVFISGANRGLGFQFARQYAEAGWQVIAGCRNPEKTEALKSIAGIETVQLDVTDDSSIATAARSLEGRSIDLLINNAGIYGSVVGDQEQNLQNMNTQLWIDVLQTNVISPFTVTRAFLPLLREGSIVGILSSELGSVAENNYGDMYGYRSSKAAVNMVGRSLAMDLKPRNISVVLLHPGWAHTDMGGPNAPVDPVESVAGLRRVLAKVTLESTGKFLAWDGREMPW